MDDELINFDAEFRATPLMLILRGVALGKAVDITLRAWDAGVGSVEVPLQSAEDLEVLQALVRLAEPRGRFVGAGTVTSVELVAAAADVGAAFTVAPGLDPAVLDASFAREMGHLPGVGTGSEIQRASALGCTWVKVFPAAALGSAWIRAMRGPFPDLGMVATGGMSSGNAGEFLDAGADVIAVGAALGDPDELARLTRIAIPVDDS